MDAAIFARSGKLHDFLFALLNAKSSLKRNVFYQGRICSLESQFFPFKAGQFENGGNYDQFCQKCLPLFCFISVAIIVYGIYILTYWPVAEKMDLRTYANSEDPDQPAHPQRLIRIFAVRPHNI